MKKIKKIIACLFSSIFIINLTGCGGTTTQVTNAPTFVYEYGDLDPGLITIPSDGVTENVKLPTYTLDNLIQAPAYESTFIEEKGSYYKEQLSGNAKKAFDNIYNAISECYSDVYLDRESYVEPDVIKKIMNIIFLDCPELFYLNTSYDYEVVKEGTKEYVSKIYFNYSMTSERIEQQKYNLAYLKPEYIKARSGNDLQTLGGVVRKLDVLNADKYLIDTNYTFSGNINSIHFAKLLCYWLRMVGIDSTIILGDVISETLTDSFEIQNKENEFIIEEYNKENNTYSVKMDYSVYWCWPIVKINNTWYHYDAVYELLLRDVSRTVPKDSLLFATDRLMSQTRISYITEDILGIYPSCEEKGFMSLYRAGYYLLPHNELQIKQRLKEEISYIIANNAVTKTYQFEDEASYDMFIDNLDSQIKAINEMYNYPIGIYKVFKNRDALIVVIYDIVHNF